MSLVFTNRNNPKGFTFNKGGFPLKPASMSQGSELANPLLTFNEGGGNPHKPYPYTNYSVNLNTTSSQITAQKKILAIGKNTNRISINEGDPSGFTNNDRSFVRSKLQRVRNQGYIAPAKKGASLISTSTKIPANKGIKLP